MREGRRACRHTSAPARQAGGLQFARPMASVPVRTLGGHSVSTRKIPDSNARSNGELNGRSLARAYPKRKGPFRMCNTAVPMPTLEKPARAMSTAEEELSGRLVSTANHAILGLKIGKASCTEKMSKYG